MLTYLDRLTSQLAGPERGDDGGPLIRATATLVTVLHGHGQPTTTAEFEALPRLSRLAWGLFEMLARFWMPEDRHPVPLAIQVPPSLELDFRGAKSPRNADDAVFEALEKHGVIYIDFPDAGGGELTLRAIFAQDYTSAAGKPMTKVFAILSERERLDIETQVEIGFTLGDHAPEHGMVGQGVPGYSDLCREIEDIARLAILYYLSSPEAAHVPLPRVDEKEYRALSGEHKRRNKLRQSSLFRVIRTDPPADRFGRTDADRGHGYSLDRRIPVRGHFKWQQHGEGRKLRKLIWVAAHERGPQDAPIKPTMTILD